MVPARPVYWLLLLGTAIGLGLATLGSDLINPRFLGFSIALTLGFDGVVLGLMVIDGLTGQANRVTVMRDRLERLSIGRENPVRLTVKSSDLSATVQIRDYVPQAFSTSEGVLALTLSAQQTQEFTYTAFPPQRGEYAWGDIQVRQLGRWGLAWQDWKVPQSQTVAVYPDLIGLRSLSIRLTLQTTGNIRQARRHGMGTEFSELREYVSGDDPRLIDWKATARRSRVVVRVLEPEQEQTLIVLLDRGRLMTAQVQGLARFGIECHLIVSFGRVATGRSRGCGGF
jgi:uncharacterized protein (DUF58 family)